MDDQIDGQGAPGTRLENGTAAESAPRSSAATAKLASILRGTPSEVLARIAEGDPLAMRERVASHLSRAAVLVDADRAHLRALAHVARAESLSGAVQSGSRLEAGLDRAASRGVHEAVRAVREASRSNAPADGVFATLAPPLGLSADGARRATAAFDDCEPAERRALFGLLAEGRSLDQLASQEGTSVGEVARRARRALEAALDALHPDTERGAVESGVEGQEGRR